MIDSLELNLGQTRSAERAHIFVRREINVFGKKLLKRQQLF